MRSNPREVTSRSKSHDGVARQMVAQQTLSGFRFIEEHSGTLPINRLCQIMNVSTRGYRAYRTRPISQSQRTDMVLLAHIRDQFAQNHNSYGRIRMTEELKEMGLRVGHRRVGRLMRQNGISVIRTRKHKVTTDSNHKFNITSNLLDRNFTADRLNQKWVVDISYIWTREGWLYLAAYVAHTSSGRACYLRIR